MKAEGSKCLMAIIQQNGTNRIPHQILKSLRQIYFKGPLDVYIECLNFEFFSSKVSLFMNQTVARILSRLR